MKLTILLMVICGVLGLVLSEQHKYAKEIIRKDRPDNVQKYVEGEQSNRNKKVYKRPFSHETDEEEVKHVRKIKTTIAETVEEEAGEATRYNEMKRNEKPAYGMKKKIVKEPKYVKKSVVETVEEEVENRGYGEGESSDGAIKYKAPIKYEKHDYERSVETPKYGKFNEKKKNFEYVPSLSKRQSFVAENFTLNMNRVKADNPAATGGTIRRLTTQNMPGLEDMSSSLKYLKPCSINLPHYHPRGSELIHVIQ